jgi:hypothetical protein
MYKLAIERINSPEYTAAEQSKIAHYHIEDGLHAARRAGNNAQYLRGRSLPLQRLVQLMGQLRDFSFLAVI